MNEWLEWLKEWRGWLISILGIAVFWGLWSMHFVLAGLFVIGCFAFEFPLVYRVLKIATMLLVATACFFVIGVFLAPAPDPEDFRKELQKEMRRYLR